MFTNTKYFYVGLVASLVVSAALLFPRIGGFGMWEPFETDRVDVVSAMVDNAKVPSNAPQGMLLGERAAAWSWSVLGKSELAARLPMALHAFVAVAILFLLTAPFVGPRIAFFASVVLASAPVFLFHGRQLTSGMPLLFGETLAMCGLACFAYGRAVKLIMAGAAAALVGMVVGSLEAGVLMGVAVPAGTIALTLAFNGDVSSIFKSAGDEAQAQRRTAFFVTAPLAILAAGAFFIVVFFMDGDIPMITGGAAASAVEGKSFDFPIRQLAFGWFPWSALVLIPIISHFSSRESAGDEERAMRCLAIVGLAVGCLAWIFFAAVRGPSPIFLVVPMALSVAFAISDLEKSEEPMRLGAIVGLACLAMMIRDFAQQPDIILSGYGFDKIAVPKDFKPLLPAAVAASPMIALILLLGFWGSGGDKPAGWRPLRSLALAPVCALVFGGYISFFLVPELSVNLSSKYSEEIYKRFRKADEPLAVYGGNRFFEGAKQLRSKDDVIEWLGQEKRSFVMFPPAELADINNRARQKYGRHISVLDATSERFILATSKLVGKERSSNPIERLVRSGPFKPGPANTMEINFDNKAALLGWSVRSEDGKPHMVKGKTATFETYWRCDGKLPDRYRIFMHLDGPGGRMNGDHDPLGDVYSTGNWAAGDYVKDVYQLKVPIYQKEGVYDVRIGLFRGNDRLKVLDYPKAVENAVLLGSLELE